MQLDGKVTVITGAASGIGRASAILFASEGAKVVIGDLSDEAGNDVVDEIRSGGGEAAFCHCNVKDIADLDKLVTFAVDSFGGLDVFWHNAGTVSRSIALETEGYHRGLTEEDWQDQMDVHLKAGFFGARRAVDEMLKRGGGAILFTSSAAALKPPVGTAPTYPIAKHGLIVLTRMMATALGKDNIRVNAICPASIRTGMIQFLLDDPSAKPIVDGLVEQMPIKRIIEVEEVARAALFLVSDNASAITGTILAVDGGRVVS